ncbi:MAG: hypothetical protein BRC36_13695 [Cyanobacteria bacterium QH_2_48_84]|nr:MAG: hypothetical protein BRC36_13695 [Cyanobacteria bacterium QH_2_48_84]
MVRSKSKDDTASLILIFWCLFAFIGSVYEHYVANITILGMGLFSPHDPSKISWIGFDKNLYSSHPGEKWLGEEYLSVQPMGM